MLPYIQSTHPAELERGPQAQREASGLVGEQVPQDEEEAMAMAILMTPMQVSEGLLDDVVRETNEEGQESPNQRREDLCLQDDEIVDKSLREEALALLPYLLYKYWSNKPVTEVEMLNRITRGHWEHFPMILHKASICTQLLFGIEMKEVDPIIHTHVLVKAAGITYDGVLSHVQGIPKTGLLIIILCIIFIDSGCATEEAIWQVLGKMEVHPDREHFLYGIPRKLLMEDFVWEQYLECQEVPNSDPTAYEFRWGPRAYAETTKMKILEHWAKFSRIDPRSISSLYEEALQEEEEEDTHDNVPITEW